MCLGSAGRQLCSCGRWKRPGAGLRALGLPLGRAPARRRRFPGPLAEGSKGGPARPTRSVPGTDTQIRPHGPKACFLVSGVVWRESGC